MMGDEGLPLLDALRERLTPLRGILRGWRCIYVQHLLASNLSCLHFLEEMGLERGDIAIFGKGYSTSKDVLSCLRLGGWQVWEQENYEYRRPFDEAIIDAISLWIRRDERSDRPILVVDEGGLASRAVSRRGRQRSRLAVVELTSRGAAHYSNVSEFAPVVDVARSSSKKTIESKYISESMFKSIISLVPSLISDCRTQKVGLVGLGAIGKALVSELGAHGVPVQTFDRDDSLGGMASLNHLVQSCAVLLSSTGGGPDWAEALRNPVGERLLINCGSSDVEFSPWRLREFVTERGGAFEVEHPRTPWRGRTTVSYRGTTFTLLRGGFPVNFDNSDDPISPQTVQLTRTILMAGAIQAAGTDSCGVIPLDEAIQHWVVDRYWELLGR